MATMHALRAKVGGFCAMKALFKILAAALFCLAAFTVNSSAWAAPPAKGTEILWDRYGVPHIFAPDRASLFYAYGYAQMEAHAELLIRLYTQSRGRAAEFGRSRCRSARGRAR